MAEWWTDFRIGIVVVAWICGVFLFGPLLLDVVVRLLKTLEAKYVAAVRRQSLRAHLRMAHAKYRDRVAVARALQAARRTAAEDRAGAADGLESRLADLAEAGRVVPFVKGRV